MVCVKLNIQTSPETLLEKLFDATGLKAVLGNAQTSIEESWAYEKLPSEGKIILSSTIATVRGSLPSMIVLVTKKLLLWKRIQRNTAVRIHVSSVRDISAKKPAAKHPETARNGANTPAQASNNTTRNDSLGTEEAESNSNKIIGILGEHITDYFLHEEYGWGSDWNAHDKGVNGSRATKSNNNFPGKLNDATKLNSLFSLKAHGVGIDGVWKVQLNNPYNDGKPFAIIESKASAVKRVPSNELKKPSIKSKLGSNARRIRKAAALRATILRATENLFEPPTDTVATNSTLTSASGKPSGTLRNAKNSKKSKQTQNNTSDAGGKPVISAAEVVLVQMSRAWIRKNIRAAVQDRVIATDISANHKHVYSRHLFYTPFYLPSAETHSLALRGVAEATGAMDSHHKKHKIPKTHQYGENDVKIAVNSKLLKLKLKQEL